MRIKNRGFSLYIHIPFCLKKCNYCDFVSFPLNKREIGGYVQYLKKEIKIFVEKKNIKNISLSTVYLGGGTPSLLTVDEMENIFSSIRENFNLLKDAEITVEANPETVELNKFKAFKDLGVNRISIGAQSFNDNTLKILGRVHNAERIYKSFNYARKAGFENINIDLMFALPDESIKDLSHSLKEAISLNPEHISFYSLMIERGTAFYRERKYLNLPNNDEEAYQYQFGIDFLEKNGYKQYEISNFAKPGFECRHNITYWENLPYIGFGVAAGSYFERKRTRNVLKLYNYYKKIDRDILPVGLYEHLKGKKAKGEHIIMNLRTLKGCDKHLYYVRFGSFPETDFGKEIKFLKENKLIREDKQFIQLTQKGLFLANVVFEQFIS